MPETAVDEVTRLKAAVGAVLAHNFADDQEGLTDSTYTALVEFERGVLAVQEYLVKCVGDIDVEDLLDEVARDLNAHEYNRGLQDGWRLREEQE